MPGFDWNGNGKKDSFDRFMEIKILSSESEVTDTSDIDDDSIDEIDDSIDEIDYNPNTFNETNYGVQTTNENETSETSFQEKLKKNMRTPEQVRKEDEERDRNAAMWEAKRALAEIKELLIYKVQRAEYEIINGVTYVSCISTRINYRYLHQKLCDNHNDPNFYYSKYKSWKVFGVDSKYKNEYYHFMTALKEIAAKENILIEPVLNDQVYGIFPFPFTSDKVSFSPRLCIKATTIIKGDKNIKNIKTVQQQQEEKNINEMKKIQEQNSENWAMTGKCILAVAVIFIAFIIAINADIGDLGRALLMIVSVVFGVFILCYSSNKK